MTEDTDEKLLDKEQESENTDKQEETRRVNVVQAARAMKCSIPTVYNRAKKHGWERGIDDNGLAWMEIPVKWLKHKYDSEEDENSSEFYQQAISSLQEAHEENKKLMEALVASKENELQAKERQIEALSNQIAAQNSQILVLRDKNKDEKDSNSLPPKPKNFLEKLAFLFSSNDS